MNTYRVDFTADDLRRDRSAPDKLMRDVKKVVKRLKAQMDEKPRYVWKRRTDRSLGYWFQIPADVSKDKEATELLQRYGWAASAAPVLPQSEWKPL